MRKYFFVALAALVVSAVSCTEEKKVDELTFTSTADVVAESSGLDATVSFTTNNAWSASVNADWVKVEPASGEAGEASVKLTADANNSDKRDAVLTVTAGSKSQEIKISQKGVLTGNAVTEDIAFDGGTVDYPYTDGSVKIDDDWVSYEVKDGKVIFTVAANESLEARSTKAVVVTGGVSTEITFNQAFQPGRMNIKRVVYLKNIADVYDNDNWCLTTFNQYALVFDSAEGEVTIVVNAPAQDDFFAGVPAGTYACDYAADHSDNTFSIKSLEGNEKYFSCMGETLVADGEVEISEDGVIATLVDGDENIHEFSFTGEFPAVEDESLGAEIIVEAQGNCATYFASNAFGYNVDMYISNNPEGIDCHVYRLSFTIYGDEVDGLPVGTFTVVDEIQSVNLPYSNGVLNAVPGTIAPFGYGYADYVVLDEDGNYEYKDASINGGTITVAKNSDGTYNFDIDLDLYVSKTEYDEEGNPSISEEFNLDYKVSLNNQHVAYTAPTQWPQPDGDSVFQAPVSNLLQPYWYGDRFETGCNVFYFGFQNLGGFGYDSYTMSVLVNAAGSYEFVPSNEAGTRSKTPMPTGTFTFSMTPGADTILPCASISKIVNNYTGTTFYITGGSITWDGENMTYDLKASTGTIIDNVLTIVDTYSFTGSHSAMYVQTSNRSNPDQYSVKLWSLPAE